MIRMIVLASIATLVLAPGAQAQCSCATNQVTNSATDSNAQNLSTTLSGHTVCVAKSGGGWQHQEWHQGGPASGAIIDYKKGPADPIDPTTALGTWSTNGTGASSRIIYSYSGGSIGVYAVCSSKSQPAVGDTIGFCADSNSPATIAATVESGGTGCQ